MKINSTCNDFKKINSCSSHLLKITVFFLIIIQSLSYTINSQSNLKFSYNSNYNNTNNEVQDKIHYNKEAINLNNMYFVSFHENQIKHLINNCMVQITEESISFINSFKSKFISNEESTFVSFPYNNIIYGDMSAFYFSIKYLQNKKNFVHFTNDEIKNIWLFSKESQNGENTIPYNFNSLTLKDKRMLNKKIAYVFEELNGLNENKKWKFDLTNSIVFLTSIKSETHSNEVLKIDNSIEVASNKYYINIAGFRTEAFDKDNTLIDESNLKKFNNTYNYTESQEKIDYNFVKKFVNNNRSKYDNNTSSHNSTSNRSDTISNITSNFNNTKKQNSFEDFNNLENVLDQGDKLIARLKRILEDKIIYYYDSNKYFMLKIPFFYSFKDLYYENKVSMDLSSGLKLEEEFSEKNKINQVFIAKNGILVQRVQTLEDEKKISIEEKENNSDINKILISQEFLMNDARSELKEDLIYSIPFRDFMSCIPELEEKNYKSKLFSKNKILAGVNINESQNEGSSEEKFKDIECLQWRLSGTFSINEQKEPNKAFINFCIKNRFENEFVQKSIKLHMTIFKIKLIRKCLVSRSQNIEFLTDKAFLTSRESSENKFEIFLKAKLILNTILNLDATRYITELFPLKEKLENLITNSDFIIRNTNELRFLDTEISKMKSSDDLVDILRKLEDKNVSNSLDISEKAKEKVDMLTIKNVKQIYDYIVKLKEYNTSVIMDFCRLYLNTNYSNGSFLIESKEIQKNNSIEINKTLKKIRKSRESMLIQRKEVELSLNNFNLYKILTEKASCCSNSIADIESNKLIKDFTDLVKNTHSNLKLPDSKITRLAVAFIMLNKSIYEFNDFNFLTNSKSNEEISKIILDFTIDYLFYVSKAIKTKIQLNTEVIQHLLKKEFEQVKNYIVVQIENKHKERILKSLNSNECIFEEESKNENEEILIADRCCVDRFDVWSKLNQSGNKIILNMVKNVIKKGKDNIDKNLDKPFDIPNAPKSDINNKNENQAKKDKDRAKPIDENLKDLVNKFGVKDDKTFNPDKMEGGQENYQHSSSLIAPLGDLSSFDDLKKMNDLEITNYTKMFSKDLLDNSILKELGLIKYDSEKC